MSGRSENHQEPFLINAATGSASAGYERRSYRRRDEESKVEADFSNLNLGSATTKLSTLRRRYRRRSLANEESDPEEGKHNGDSYSPRDKPASQESKESDTTPAKPPKYSEPSPRPPIDDAAGRAMKEEKTPHSLPIAHHSNYIRKPDEKLREKFKNRLRSSADGIPEVHFIGEMTEGIGFKDTYVSCKWYLEWGKSWSFLAGEEASQTQYSASDDGVQVWNHPVDVHFAAASMQGWPRIVVQVWELDEYGRSILSGYGFAHLPTNPGYHELDIHCWRPSGSMVEELQSFFLGTSSCLVDENAIFGKAWEARSRLVTVSSGVVRMNLNVILRFFGEQKVA